MDELKLDREQILRLLDELPDPLHIMDQDHRLLLANKAFKKLNAELGLPAGIEGKTLKEIFPFLGQAVLDEYRRAFGGETVVTEELNRFGERRVWTETKKSPFPLDGQRKGVITLVRDITVHKLVSEALLEERQLFVGGPTVVFTWGAEEGWPVEYVSPNVLQQFGYPVEDFLCGKVVYTDIVHPDDLPRVVKEVEAYCEARVPHFEQEYRLRHSDGIYRWVRDFTVVKRDEAGTLLRFHGYIQDITDFRTAEDEVRRLQEQTKPPKPNGGRKPRKKPD